MQPTAIPGAFPRLKHRVKGVLRSPVFITAFAFVLRMVVLQCSTSAAPVPVRDNLPYGFELGQVARSIAAGHGFSSPLRMVDSGPTAWFTPVYPYLVAGIFKFWGIYTFTSYVVIQTLNCAFSALTIIPIYEISKKTFGREVGVGAAWAWVFFPTALFFPILWIWDTTLAALFFALIFWATLELKESTSAVAWAGYGLLWAIGVLVNPSVLSVFPFLLMWLTRDAQRKGSHWIKMAAATLAFFAVCLVPWTVRNYRVFHKAIVLRSNFGLELWLGNNPNVADSWSPWMHPNDDSAEAERYRRMGEIPYMAEKEKEAFDFMKTHPVDTVNFMLHRFVENWLGVTDSPSATWSGSRPYVKAFVVLNSLFSLMCLLGALFACRSQNPEALPYALVLLIFPLVFYLTHSSLRYRFPIDPIMMALAASAVAHLIGILVGRTTAEKSAEVRAQSLPSI